MRSLPYALARFGILLAYTLASIVWLVVTFGGAAWLGTHIAGAFGVVWFVICIVGVGWFWGACCAICCTCSPAGTLPC